MSSILLDNWTLECAFNNFFVDVREDYEKKYSHPNPLDLSWINFLTALVFWNELWYINNNLSTWVWTGAKENLTYRALLPDFPSFVHSDFTLLDEIIRPICLADYFSPENELMFIENDGLYQVIEQRAEGYLAIANILSISYLPYPQRAEHINSLLPGKIRFSRLDVLKKLDINLNEYYNAINKEIGRSMLNFNYPVVYDYIKKGSANLFEELHSALELRNCKELGEFKDSIFDIELSANSGNIQKLSACLKTTRDLSNEVLTKLDCKTIEVGTISLGLSPSIDIPVKFKRNRAAFHTSFLKDIVQFGIERRI